MTSEDIIVIRKRLTAEHLTENTLIFRPQEAFDFSTANCISLQFEQYWKTWVAPELEKLFLHIGMEPERKIKYKRVPIRKFGRIIGTMVRMNDKVYLPIKGGVLISGPGFKRVIKNSFYDDINTDSL